ncbi:hypothetical protein [Priestia megaterium]|uniref:hypothetical protein n=1 Tax=Priestia megaterium TaxID=1404 RepID=UPI0022B927F4|nr:hypothetical protein [Priestia megaterium]MCZ8497359.1 hypothetical protein [Priestia megaterium]
MSDNRIYGVPESVIAKSGFNACSLPLHHIDTTIIDKATQLSKTLQNTEQQEKNLEEVLLNSGIDEKYLDFYTKELVTLKLLCNSNLQNAAKSLNVEKFLEIIQKEELLLQECSSLGIESVGASASVAVNGYVFTTIAITVAGPNTYGKDIKAIAYKLGGAEFAELIEF